MARTVYKQASKVPVEVSRSRTVALGKLCATGHEASDAS
jgi:hypothetical protein